MRTVTIHTQIGDIPASQWDGLRTDDNPFTRHAFLHALERSGCVGGETGWQPLHLALHQGDKLVAAMPLYLKYHPWGEYVFDWVWEEAWAQYGEDYYPKLVTAIPFTPSVGPRLLFDATQLSLDDSIAAMTQASRQLCEEHNLSSWHTLFIPPTTRHHYQHQSLLLRQGCQYHWYNRGYQQFDDFLNTMTAKRRKTVKRERRRCVEQEITLKTLVGHDITEAHLTQFYHFYQLTYLKRGRQGYLNQAFFQQLRQTMPEQLVLVMAYHHQEAVAGALSFKDRHHLYGRYWGCLEEYDSLHFETCYYRGIDYCIDQGLQHFDAGAQGEHKIQRGFEPIATWSAHWIELPVFRQAIKHYVETEQQQMTQHIQQLRQRLPFHRSSAEKTT